MKRILFVVTGLVLASTIFPQAAAANLHSKQAGQRRLEVRIQPFVDLYSYIYKVSSGSEKAPDIEGFPEAVEAARRIPFSATFTKGDLIPFRCDTAAEAIRVFAEYPETYKTSKGEIIPLRERAVELAKRLAAIEKSFMEKVWPQHKVVIQQAAALIAETLGRKEQECFTFMTRHLGMEDAKYIVPIYLVAESPWPGGFTIWGDDQTRGVCLLSVAANKGPDFLSGLVHEVIHALDLETKGKGNVLVELRDRLLKAGFDKDSLFVRHAPHFLVFIQSVETVRRKLDSTYQPYEIGVFGRPELQPIKNVELPIWTAYLDGKLSREDALNQMIDGFLKMRNRDAPANVKP